MMMMMMKEEGSATQKEEEEEKLHHHHESSSAAAAAATFQNGASSSTISIKSPPQLSLPDDAQAAAVQPRSATAKAEASATTAAATTKPQALLLARDNGEEKQEQQQQQQSAVLLLAEAKAAAAFSLPNKKHRLVAVVQKADDNEGKQENSSSSSSKHSSSSSSQHEQSAPAAEASAVATAEAAFPIPKQRLVVERQDEGKQESKQHSSSSSSRSEINNYSPHHNHHHHQHSKEERLLRSRRIDQNNTPFQKPAPPTLTPPSPHSISRRPVLQRPKSPYWQQQQRQQAAQHHQQQQQGEIPQPAESDVYDDDDVENEDSFITPPSLLSQCMEYAFLLSWHIVCLAVYIIPVLFTPLPSEYASSNYSPQSGGRSISSPVLDEMHIMSNDNHDIHGHLDLTMWQVLHRVFTNDYWGRPMNSPSSHKSWRPLTVLSFRWFKHAIGNYSNEIRTKNELLGHRLVNIVTHAAAAELVAIVAVKLLMPLYTTTTRPRRRQWQLQPPSAAAQQEGQKQLQKQQQQPQPPQEEQSFLYYRNRRRQRLLLLHSVTKMLFILHPTHVEVVANAANRPHLLAIVFALVLCDPDVSSSLVYTAALLCGFLSAETFIFAVPATLVTRSAILYQRHQYYHQAQIQEQQQHQSDMNAQQQQPELANGQQQHHHDMQQQSNGDSGSQSTTATPPPLSQCDPKPAATVPTVPSPPLPLVPPLYRQVCNILYQTLLEWCLSTCACLAYMSLRYQLDWLSIPDGLIRPAENPFFHLTGHRRVVSYAYILALHVLKSWDVDVIGFSHEYGHACIVPLESMYDIRLLCFVGIVLVLLTIGVYLVVTTIIRRNRQQSLQQQQPRRTVLSTGCILYLVHLSWMLTLFPITGIVKVGTFVADRIVVPSTISFTIVVAYILTFWLDFKCFAPSQLFHFPNRLKWMVLVGLVLPLSWRRIHVRTLQWMDSLPLLESSLQTCPNSAKSHLEISKIYSGLYPRFFNLDTARHHLKRVQEIDAHYCDVHQQLAQIAIQARPMPRYLEFEEELLQALLCPYTMGGAMNMWKQYWDQTLGPNSHNTDAQRQAVQERYNRYMRTINDAIAKEDREHQERATAAAAKAAASAKSSGVTKNKSPFVWGSGEGL